MSREGSGCTYHNHGDFRATSPSKGMNRKQVHHWDGEESPVGVCILLSEGNSISPYIQYIFKL